MNSGQAATVSVVHDDPFAAAQEAADELLDALGAPPDLVLLFFSADFLPDPIIEGLYTRLPAKSRMVGCSSYAEINRTEAVTHSVTALGLRLSGIACHPFSIRPAGLTSFETGRRAAADLRAFSPDLLLVFPDVLHVNLTQFLLGLQDVLGSRFPIIGGASADRGEFKRTYQVCDRTALCDGVVGVALKGPIRMATAARSGYMPIGVPRICTRVENGNIIREIDGRPALQVYLDLLGERASEMPTVSSEFPLGVVGGILGTQRHSGDEVLLVRCVFRVDEARQALILGGDIPEGAEIHVTRTTRADVIRGAEEATVRALAAMPDPDLALLFNCTARKQCLGPLYKEECAAAFKHLGLSVPKIGFYACGELSPVDGVTMHHESTFTTALLKLGS
jgi:hypothetical protein